MPRDGEPARRRLRAVALDLYGERGFEAVTAAEIAARAGVTERTFFRHFADKREVLFDGEMPLREALSGAILDAPRASTPLQTLLRAFLVVTVPRQEADREMSMARRRVIAASPALRERDLAKADRVTAALSAALVSRGIDPSVARLAAEVAMVMWTQALDAWFTDPTTPLETHLIDKFDAFQKLT